MMGFMNFSWIHEYQEACIDKLERFMHSVVPSMQRQMGEKARPRSGATLNSLGQPGTINEISTPVTPTPVTAPGGPPTVPTLSASQSKSGSQADIPHAGQARRLARSPALQVLQSVLQSTPSQEGITIPNSLSATSIGNGGVPNPSLPAQPEGSVESTASALEAIHMRSPVVRQESSPSQMQRPRSPS